VPFICIAQVKEIEETQKHAKTGPSVSWYASFQYLWITRRTGQLNILERLMVGNPAKATSLANL
jgi:hypothetical protein